MKKMIITSAFIIGFLFANCWDSFGQGTKEYMTVEYYTLYRKYVMIDNSGVKEVDIDKKNYEGLSIVLKKINDLTQDGWSILQLGYSTPGSGAEIRYCYLLERDL